MGPRRLIVTDLDGTLLGDDSALERFVDWYAAARSTHWLAYATGRSQASLQRLTTETRLPRPDVLISMVGTEVHDREGRPLRGWMDRFDGSEADRAREILVRDRRLELQPAEAQTQLKASFFAADLTAGDLDEIRQALGAAGFDATIVYSGSLFLDVLPAAAGKGKAAREVAGALGVASRDVLAFGDSGNDVELFTQGFRGTIVANALPELRSAVGPEVYRSPFSFADGVLDGIRYWRAADGGTPKPGGRGARSRAAAEPGSETKSPVRDGPGQ